MSSRLSGVTNLLRTIKGKSPATGAGSPKATSFTSFRSRFSSSFGDTFNEEPYQFERHEYRHDVMWNWCATCGEDYDHQLHEQVQLVLV